jgi:hypothetical protein
MNRVRTASHDEEVLDRCTLAGRRRLLDGAAAPRALNTLAQCVEDMRATRQAHLDACRAAWAVLLSGRPEVRELLNESCLDEEQAGPMFWKAHFDGGERSAIELFAEGRGEEVVARIRKMMYGVY